MPARGTRRAAWLAREEMLQVHVVERVHAAILLAWALVRSLLAPLLGARRGLAAFRASYEKDRLPPVLPDERRQFGKLGGCIACGLCNVGEGTRMVGSMGRYAGVMDLVLASSRSMPDYDAAARSFALVDDARLASLETLCPGRVPMRALRKFVLAKAEQAGEA